MPTQQRPLKVFLCHAPSDENTVRDLYLRLGQDGVDAWLNSENLLPGQDRNLEIRKAVRESDAVVVCLSERFNQAGPQQREAKVALDEALEQPEGEIFIIPALLEKCEIPESLSRYQWVDLSSEMGYEKLKRALDLDAEKKRRTFQPGKEKTQGKKQDPVLPAHASEETSRPLPPVRAALERLRFLLDIKYLSVLIAILVLLFGNNIYAQITGHSLFTNPPTPTQTATITSTATSSATSTETLTPTATITQTPTVTLTPVTPTDTVTPTLTLIPPVPLGEDWLAGCISTLWVPYPSSVIAAARGDGCWKEPLHGYSAEYGDLDFLAQRKNGPVEVYGLFAPLPERGTVTIRIRLRDLNNVDLWMGVFAESDINSEGLLMIVPAGNAKQRPFVQKNPGDYETIASTRVLEQLDNYSISFRFTENSARSTINPGVFGTNPVPIASAKKWLFLGYRGLRGPYRVDGTFLSFELK